MSSTPSYILAGQLTDPNLYKKPPEPIWIQGRPVFTTIAVRVPYKTAPYHDLELCKSAGQACKIGSPFQVGFCWAMTALSAEQSLDWSALYTVVRSQYADNHRTAERWGSAYIIYMDRAHYDDTMRIELEVNP